MELDNLLLQQLIDDHPEYELFVNFLFHLLDNVDLAPFNPFELSKKLNIDQDHVDEYLQILMVTFRLFKEISKKKELKASDIIKTKRKRKKTSKKKTAKKGGLGAFVKDGPDFQLSLNQLNALTDFHVLTRGGTGLLKNRMIKQDKFMKLLVDFPDFFDVKISNKSKTQQRVKTTPIGKYLVEEYLKHKKINIVPERLEFEDNLVVITKEGRKPKSEKKE